MNKERRQFHKTRQMAEMKMKESVIDATGCVAGRLATAVAKRLLMGEKITILNSEKAIVSGHPDAVKARYTFKRDVGTRRKGPFLPKQSHMLLKRTVRGMIPYQLPNGRAALKRLICHLGVPPEFKDKQPEVIAGAKKLVPMGLTLGEISNFLGAKPVEVKA
jgi:large subunit ribosomal protein L13